MVMALKNYLAYTFMIKKLRNTHIINKLSFVIHPSQMAAAFSNAVAPTRI